MSWSSTLRLSSSSAMSRSHCPRAVLAQNAKFKSKGVEHLYGAAGDPIGLAKEQRTGLLLNDPSIDFRKFCQLRRQGRPAGPQPMIRTSTSAGRGPDDRGPL
jgi:hypothetical protein